MEEDVMVKPRFQASQKEVVAALLTYVLGYIWIRSDVMIEYRKWIFTLFLVGMSCLVLWFVKSDRAPKEQWVWFGCMWACMVAHWCIDPTAFGFGQSQALMFLFGMYWIYCRSGKLLENKSGNYILYDVWNGIVVNPLGPFLTFVRTRVLLWKVNDAKKEPKIDTTNLSYSILALGISIVILCVCAYLLGRADSLFASWLQWFNFDWLFHYQWDYELFLFGWSIPLGALLFAYMYGAMHMPMETLEQQRSNIRLSMRELRKVPYKTWIFIVGLFNAMYLLYSVSASIVIYTYSVIGVNVVHSGQDARQGFFELCVVMVLNFVVLWLVHYTSDARIQEQKWLKRCVTVLVCECIFISMTAFIKLTTYMSWGFTPKRLLSTWLVCVLAFGCISYLVQLLKHKEMMGIWLYVASISLALLHFM